MAEWTYAQGAPDERLARLHFFSILKRQDEVDVEFTITVKEYISPPDPSMVFYAVADKQTNQKTAPFTPCGWGPTLLEALAGCRSAILRFPYEGD
ncbi:MAG: hypothetical protein R2762_28720 [Bryobacteraceae bacterium]